MLASIGHHNAVAVIYGVKLSGLVAWVLWRGVYLSKLPTLSDHPTSSVVRTIPD